MLGFHEKRRLRRVLYSRASLVAMLVPIGFVSYVAWHAYNTEQVSRERQLALATELGQLEARAGALEHDIAALEDPYGVEAALRQRYNVAKEGEEVFVLVEPEEPRGAEATSSPAAVKTSLWERIVGIVGWKEKSEKK